jgi:molybdopterin-synthase adenylyltransferase
MLITDETIFSLNPSVALFKKDTEDTTLAFLFRDSRRLVQFKSNNSLIAILSNVDGIKSVVTLAEIANVTTQEIISIFSSLFDENIIILETGKPKNHSFFGFDRQLNFFSNFSNSSSQMIEMQEKITRSHVTILGAGGIGSWVAHELVRSGIKNLILIDPDIVELSNLPRTVIYSVDDIGKKKADVLRDKLSLLMGDLCKIESVTENIETSNQLRLYIENADLVINCADFPDVQTTNSIVSNACFDLNVPHITCGGYDGHLSYIGQTVIPKQSSCWFCYCEGSVHEDNTDGFEHIPLNKNQRIGGTLGSISSITASIQVLEALKVLSGFDTPTMLNRRSEFDFSTFQMNFIDIPRLANCSQCGENHGI